MTRKDIAAILTPPTLLPAIFKSTYRDRIREAALMLSISYPQDAREWRLCRHMEEIARQGDISRSALRGYCEAWSDILLDYHKDEEDAMLRTSSFYLSKQRAKAL